MLCNFNSRLGEYEQQYKVCSLLYDKPHKELGGDELPKWARKDYGRRTDETTRILGERREEVGVDLQSVSGTNNIGASEINWNE
jgi:hypothetical protein